MRLKKPARKEHDRPDVVKPRQDWGDGQLALDSEHVVFIDETWDSTNMLRRHGRCPRGETLMVGIPHRH